VDLGSGLGHVPLLVSMLCGIRTLGVELQPAYVACARECAQKLGVRQARFVANDARVADLTSGSVFYLFTPFTGSVLREVLERLREESTRRQIRVCSLGPCTRELQSHEWLRASARPETGRIAVFASQ
jgi:predicted RNA methylase